MALPETKAYGDEGPTLDLPCEKCSQTTSHKVLTKAEWIEVWIDFINERWIAHYIVQCQGCKSIGFCQRRLEHKYDLGADAMLRETHVLWEMVYPRRMLGIRMMAETRRLPLISSGFMRRHTTHSATNFMFFRPQVFGRSSRLSVKTDW